MDPDPALSRAFVSTTKRFFEMHDKIQHNLSINNDHCHLLIPTQRQEGFDISVEVNSNQITYHLGGYHDHLDLDGDPHEFVNHFFGFLYDSLSTLMRVREFRSGSSAYKWILECRSDDVWETEGTSGLLFYNYFGSKTEAIYQNSVIPERQDPLL